VKNIEIPGLGPVMVDAATGSKFATGRKIGDVLDDVKAKMTSFSKGSGAVEDNYVLFNKTHKNALPKPKGDGPNGGALQSHHGLQQKWAKENLAKYGYDPDLAPTVTIETGKGLPHTSITNAQNARKYARVEDGMGKWSTSLQDELKNLADDFRNAGFSKSTTRDVLEQQYKMLDKLEVPYERIVIE
jgi:hypothetical protein